MGALFGIGLFVGLFCIAALLIFIATVILVVRFVLKRKSGKKHRVMQVMGILTLILGGTIMLVPLGCVGLLRAANSENPDYVKYEETAYQYEDSYEIHFRGDVYSPLSGLKASNRLEISEPIANVDYRGNILSRIMCGITGFKNESTVSIVENNLGYNLIYECGDIYCRQDQKDQFLKDYEKWKLNLINYLEQYDEDYELMSQIKITKELTKFIKRGRLLTQKEAIKLYNRIQDEELMVFGINAVTETGEFLIEAATFYLDPKTKSVYTYNDVIFGGRGTDEIEWEEYDDENDEEYYQLSEKDAAYMISLLEK